MKLMAKLNKYLLFKNPIYYYFLSRNSDQGFLINPNSLWLGNKKNGDRIINGFLNHQGESFPINDFWKNNASISWKNHLNSFIWIKDLRALGTNDSRIFLRNFLKDWILKNKYFSQTVWADDILSKRIFSLLTNLSFYFDTADENFQKNFINFVYAQVIYLFSKVKSNNIFCLKAKLLASICLKSLNNSYKTLTSDLNRLLDEEFLGDGMYFTRSPSDHFLILCSLIDIRNFLATAKIEIPKSLNIKIDEMISVLKFFRIADGQLAIFNDHRYIQSKKIENVIKKSREKKKKIPYFLHEAGYHRVSKNKLIFLMDCGQPNEINTYAGSLSFEFSHQRKKNRCKLWIPFH